jgi:hypothetical protein
MTDEKIYIIAKKLISLYPKSRDMESFLSNFKVMFLKQMEFFSRFDDESLFKLFVFIYQLSQVDSDLNLDYLLFKVTETEIIVTFFTSYEYVTETCPQCGGDGEEKCDNCDGTGEVECPECDATGQDDEGNSCMECSGRGEIPCDWCDSEGSFTCDDCSGEGEIEDWEKKLIRAFVEISDNPEVNSELKKYEDTTTPLPEDLNDPLQELQNYDIMVQSAISFDYVEDEKFVRQILTQTKIKGQLLKEILWNISDSTIQRFFYSMK